MKDVSPPKTMRDTTNLLTAIRHQTRELSPLDASFAGQTMVLTGATGGICGRTARLLAEHGAATLVLGVRNLAKGERVAAELRRGLDPPPEVLLWPLDLASFASVRAFAARVAALPRLDVVMLGAGVMTNDTVVTEDGWEQSTYYAAAEATAAAAARADP